MSHTMPRFFVTVAAVCATVLGAAVWGTAAANAVDVGPTARSVISWDPGNETNIGGEAIGPTGTIWVSQYASDGSGGSILGFAPGTSGTASPEFDITGLAKPWGIAIDADGNIWVADYGNEAVFEYAAGATGDATPIDTIDMPTNPSGVAIGPDGSIYVALNDQVDVYTPGPGNTVTSLRAITGLVSATGVAVQANGTLVVEAANTVETFAANASGNASPVYSNSGPLTELATGFPASLAIDPWGEIYVANAATPGVTEYAQGAQNNAAPVARLVGGSTGLSDTPAVAVDSGGSVYVGHVEGTTNYISIFDPLVTVSGVTSSSGTSAGGQPVTIDGSTFVAPIDVTFGGVPASDVQVVSPTEITAVTPAHAAGAVDVAVGTATLASGFTYVAPTLTGDPDSTVILSDPATDQVTVTSPATTESAALTWDAYQQTAGQADTCTADNNVYSTDSNPTAVVLDGDAATYSPPSPPTFPEAGTYDWVVTLIDPTTNAVLAQTQCGDPTEQTTVAYATITGNPGPAVALTDSSTDPVTVTSPATTDKVTLLWDAYRQSPGQDDTCNADNNVYSTDLNPTAVVLDGDAATYSPPSPPTFSEAGTYDWVVTLIDVTTSTVLAENVCGDSTEQTTVVAFTLTTSATPIGSGGIRVSDTATITGPTPTGATIQFSAYPQNDPNADCGATPAYTSSRIPVTGPGTYTSGTSILPHGRYAWVATTYDRDGNVLQAGGCGDPDEITTIIPGLAFTGTVVNAATQWGALAAVLLGGLLVGCGLLTRRTRRRTTRAS